MLVNKDVSGSKRKVNVIILKSYLTAGESIYAQNSQIQQQLIKYKPARSKMKNRYRLKRKEKK